MKVYNISAEVPAENLREVMRYCIYSALFFRGYDHVGAYTMTDVHGVVVMIPDNQLIKDFIDWALFDSEGLHSQKLLDSIVVSIYQESTRKVFENWVIRITEPSTNQLTTTFSPIHHYLAANVYNLVDAAIEKPALPYKGKLNINILYRLKNGSLLGYIIGNLEVNWIADWIAGLLTGNLTG